MSKHGALLNCIEDIYEVIGGNEPEFITEMLLRMGLINEGNSQKLGLDSFTPKKKALLISNTFLLKIKAESEKHFPDFVSFLRKKFDSVVATISQKNTVII